MARDYTPKRGEIKLEIGDQAIGNWWIRNWELVDQATRQLGDQELVDWEEREWRFEIRERHPPKPFGNISVRGGAEAGDTRKSRGASAREERDWNFWKKFGTNGGAYNEGTRGLRLGFWGIRCL